MPTAAGVRCELDCTDREGDVVHGDLMLRAALTTVLIGLTACWIGSASTRAGVFRVDSTGDHWDSRPGDGICTTVLATCTLRAALEEASAGSDADLILVPGGNYRIETLNRSLDHLIELRGLGAVELEWVGARLEQGSSELRLAGVDLLAMTVQAGRLSVTGGSIGSLVVEGGGVTASESSLGSILMHEGGLHVDRSLVGGVYCPDSGTGCDSTLVEIRGGDCLFTRTRIEDLQYLLHDAQRAPRMLLKSFKRRNGPILV